MAWERESEVMETFKSKSWAGKEIAKVSPRISSYWSVCKLEDLAGLSFRSQGVFLYRRSGLAPDSVRISHHLAAPLGALHLANLTLLFQPPGSGTGSLSSQGCRILDAFFKLKLRLNPVVQMLWFFSPREKWCIECLKEKRFLSLNNCISTSPKKACFPFSPCFHDTQTLSMFSNPGLQDLIFSGALFLPCSKSQKCDLILIYIYAENSR